MADDPARRPPRARPVAGLSVERLEDRAETLARRWAGALVMMRPLGSLGRISLEEVVRAAPELCRQVLRALGSDGELERLLDAHEPARGGPFADRPAALSGARDASAVVEAVESLRGALWEELAIEAAAWPERSRERLLADAGDRLAHVCAVLSAVAVERERPAAAARPARFPERPPGARRAAEQRVVIVDEQAAEQGEELPPFGSDAPAGESARAQAAAAILAPGSGPDEVLGVRRGEDERFAGGDRGSASPIAIRDARREQGPSAWIRSIGDQLERYGSDRAGFAVVLMQIAGAGEAEEDLETALAAELRAAGGGRLTREREGRYWLLVPRADRIGAETLAAQLRQAAERAASAAGYTAEVVTGAAVCPQDGARAAELAAHADVALYAARWEQRGARRGADEPL